MINDLLKPLESNQDTNRGGGSGCFFLGEGDMIDKEPRNHSFKEDQIQSNSSERDGNEQL